MSAYDLGSSRCDLIIPKKLFKLSAWRLRDSI